MFGGWLVSWRWKKQSMVALSSWESECIVLLYASQEAIHQSDLMSELTCSHFCFCAHVRGHHGSFSAIRYYSKISFSERAGCRTRSSYLMSRQQIRRPTFPPNSWPIRRLRPSWTRSSPTLFEMLYQMIINICIITCIEGRVFVIVLFLVCAVCSTSCSSFGFVLICTCFKYSICATSTRYTQTCYYEIHVLSSWSNLCKMLATLTTTATPRYSEGVGTSGDLGRFLGLLLIAIFMSMVQANFMVLLFIRSAITNAAILFS